MKLVSIFPLTLSVLLISLLLFGWLVCGYTGQVIFFPVIVGLATCLFCARQIGIDLSSSDSIQGGQASISETLKTLAAFSLIIPAIMVLGFSLGPAVYIFFYLRWRGVLWRHSFYLGLMVFGVVNLLFVQLLKTPLPSSLLGF